MQSPASTIRNTRRTSSAPRHETTLPLRGFPVCLSNNPADRSMRSASLPAFAQAEGLLRIAGRKAAPFAWGLSRLQGVWGREASKRKGPPGEGSWFSKGRRHRRGRAGVWRHSAAQDGTIPGFPGLATSVGARKARFRARTARSGPKRPEPRSGKPGIVPKRRLKPFRGSESPGTRQRSSQDGPSRTAPIRQRPKGAPPTSRERGRSKNLVSRFALPFAGRALARPYGGRTAGGRVARSNRPRVGRRDCPFVPLCRRPSRT